MATVKLPVAAFVMFGKALSSLATLVAKLLSLALLPNVLVNESAVMLAANGGVIVKFT